MVVVVDAFRASVTIAVLVQKRARAIPVASIEEAARIAGADFRIGERGSAKVEGFDFGNSPTEDESAAGAILHEPRERGARLDERAQRVVGLYCSGSKAALRANSAARRLKRLGYEKDLDFCLAEDAVPVAPRLKDGAFVGGTP